MTPTGPGLFAKLDGSPRPLDEIIVTLDDLADLFGVSKPTIMRWARDEDLPRQAHGRYRLAECVRWQFRRMAGQGGRESSEIVESRRMLYDTQRAKHELEMQQMRRELLNAEEVATAIRSMFGIVATQLDGLGPRMAARLAGMSDPQKIAKELLTECRNIRRATAESIEDFAHVLADESVAPSPKRRRPVGQSKTGASRGAIEATAAAD